MFVFLTLRSGARDFFSNKQFFGAKFCGGCFDVCIVFCLWWCANFFFWPSLARFAALSVGVVWRFFVKLWNTKIEQIRTLTE